ncbi:MAG: hypothetical protein LC650_05070 [Actinobacteria bacterium]|nr:hypothetical protein [Actinomycetota bacterium]
MAGGAEPVNEQALRRTKTIQKAGLVVFLVLLVGLFFISVRTAVIFLASWLVLGWVLSYWVVRRGGYY